MVHRHKLIKALIIFISGIIIIVVIVILCISPITKYLIEKYDEKYTGRQITMDWVYVNPFTGYIHFKNLKIYELKSDSIFFSASGVSVNFAMLKLLSKTIEITKITLDRPKGMVIQNKKGFNFNDLIKKFTPKNPAITPEKTAIAASKVHFNILTIKINDGVFYYDEKRFPIHYFIKNVNIESTGKRWSADTMAVQFSFFSGPGSGVMKGDFTINFKNNDYRLAIIVHKFDLKILEQYLKALTNNASFSANLDADMKARGNLSDAENVTSSGLLAINDFHFGKNPKDDYASFDKLVLAIYELSPKNHKYLFDSVSVSHPYFKYERYDYLDNMQTMFGKKGANISAAVKAEPAKFNLVVEIAKYVKVLAKNFFQSNYKINRLAIYKGDLKFNDFSISEKFSIALNPLNIIADSIDKNHKRVNVLLKSGIQPYGYVSINLSMNPKNYEDFDLRYNLQKIPVSMFNPYIITYTSFPLDRGTIEFNGTWNVRNSNIQSVNHVVIIDPRVTKRLRNKDMKWIPMPLIMSFIRERGNVIDYEIPVTGNLKNPKFHLHDVLMDLIENIFVKPATTPYRMEVKNAETEIEKFLALKWIMRHSSFGSLQEKFLEKMADFLVENPDALITVYPKQYAIKEKEYILFFEAKKKFFLITHHKNVQSFSEEDSENVEKMSVKDSIFVHYLNKLAKDSRIFTIQEKCALLVDPAIINAKFKQLSKERMNNFMFYFKKKNVEKQIKISSTEDVIPYNGFSFYKIEYKGEYPKYLLKSYKKINELNDEAPREKFKKDHKYSKSTL